jgi:hypothetical protein
LLVESREQTKHVERYLNSIMIIMYKRISFATKLFIRVNPCEAYHISEPKFFIENSLYENEKLCYLKFGDPARYLGTTWLLRTPELDRSPNSRYQNFFLSTHRLPSTTCYLTRWSKSRKSFISEKWHKNHVGEVSTILE